MHFKLIDEVAGAIDILGLSDEELGFKIEQFLAERHSQDPSQKESGLSEKTCQRVRAEFLGWGPVEHLLQDDSVTEIMVNGSRNIWYEQQGRLLRLNDHFHLPKALDRVVRKELTRIGRKIDIRTPVADGRLGDGSRICAILPPAVQGGEVHVAIRKFPRHKFSLHDLLERGTLTGHQAEYLKQQVADRKNLLLVGATSSGKTTLLNALASAVSTDERIISLEDICELKIAHPNVVALEARPANIENEGAITLEQLLRSALRMRPDRLIVGECRGPEVYCLLQALNTGHAGSMATIHANSSREALYRLESLALLSAGNVQADAIRRYICSAIDCIVFLKKAQGQRVISEICELRGVDSGNFMLRPAGC